MSIVPFSGLISLSSSDTSNGHASWIDGRGSSSWHWKTFSGASAAGFTSRFDIFKNLKALNTSWAWAGCFETQPYPQNVNDIPPGASTPDSLYVPYLAPDEVDSQRTCSGKLLLECRHHRLSEQLSRRQSVLMLGHGADRRSDAAPRACKYKSPVIASTSTNGPNGMCLSQPLLRLTPSKSALISKINGLPNAPLSEGKPYNTSTPTNQKVLVLMTDGYNNWSAAAN